MKNKVIYAKMNQNDIERLSAKLTEIADKCHGSLSLMMLIQDTITHALLRSAEETAIAMDKAREELKEAKDRISELEEQLWEERLGDDV